MQLKDAQPERDRMTSTVPLRVRVAAYAVPVCVLPSAVWRLLFIISVAIRGPGPCDPDSLGEDLYIASLSVVMMGLAYLTVGLVRPWGEVFPRWMPFVGGWDVPARVATAVAMFGAAAMGLLTVFVVVEEAISGGASKPMPAGCSRPGFDVLVYYTPMVAWAPLLAFVALHYLRRRTAKESAKRSSDS